jgi:GDPmannose 4,6-dehydratase
LLLENGYEVVGMVRRSSTPNVSRIEHLLDRVTQAGRSARSTVASAPARRSAAARVQPRRHVFVPASWDQPMLTGELIHKV